MEMKAIIDRAHNHATAKGFYKEIAADEIINKLSEETTEFRFAMVAKEHALFDRDTENTLYGSPSDKDYIYYFEELIKDTAGDELADIIITALAGAKELNIPIEKHIQAKLKYNEIREDHKNAPG